MLLAALFRPASSLGSDNGGGPFVQEILVAHLLGKSGG